MLCVLDWTAFIIYSLTQSFLREVFYKRDKTKKVLIFGCEQKEETR